MKKHIFLVIATVIFFAVAYFAVINFDRLVSYTCLFNNKTYTMSLGLLILAVGLMADMGGFLYAVALQENIAKTCNAYQKRNENIAVKSEEDSAKILALEAKIDTLETALRSALDRN